MDIMQEMIDNNESCRIIETDSGYIVKLRPKAIEESLNDKLSIEDITTGMSIVNRQIMLSNLKSNLYRQCNNINCKVKDKCVFRAIPNGNTNADVMFLNKIPTDYEIGNMCSHSDRNGTFLSLILSKMNVSRDSIYCTDMIKCNKQLDEQSFKECIYNYVVKEIEYVIPKVIICNGLSLLKTCIKLKVINNLPVEVTYGKIYEAETATGQPVKVIAIYDLDTVLKKTDSEYTRCKTELWSQILSAFKAIGGNNNGCK
jgi:DNA polymerase